MCEWIQLEPNKMHERSSTAYEVSLEAFL